MTAAALEYTGGRNDQAQWRCARCWVVVSNRKHLNSHLLVVHQVSSARARSLEADAARLAANSDSGRPDLAVY